MPDTAQTPRTARIVTARSRRPPPPADPCAMVIFGAGGDLTKRLVVPALYNLARTGVLPADFALIGVDLAEGTDESWRKSLHNMLCSFVGNPAAEFRVDAIDDAVWQRLAERMTYVQGDITAPAVYEKIGAALKQAESAHRTRGNALFYLAVADRFFGTVVDQLGAAKLTETGPEAAPWRRVVIEKPFGHDLESAKALNARILRSLREDQIFRIDHFLGKDTVQSIMALRFGNGMFEPIWNRDRIDHVQITVAETIGVERRGKFYEVTGALRDMVPNHVFSLLSMVAMEPPSSFDPGAIRNRKADLFAAMPAVLPDHAVRGQYGAGAVAGQEVRPYREEPDVSPISHVETYVAMQLQIDNWRWSGVPFFIRTGKHMSHRLTEIAIRFRQAPFAPFHDTPVDALAPNWLVLRIAPDEAISLQFEVKRPGPVLDLATVAMEFCYADWFPKEPNVGYETLIYDVMLGDPTLFMRADMVEQAWRVVQPVLDAWAKDGVECDEYASGSDGPPAAAALIGTHHHRLWRPVDPQAGGDPAHQKPGS
jgi:glucose-6-phosphate 1-dehydrogenase